MATYLRLSSIEHHSYAEFVFWQPPFRTKQGLVLLVPGQPPSAWMRWSLEIRENMHHVLMSTSFSASKSPPPHRSDLSRGITLEAPLRFGEVDLTRTQSTNKFNFDFRTALEEWGEQESKVTQISMMPTFRLAVSMLNAPLTTRSPFSFGRESDLSCYYRVILDQKICHSDGEIWCSWKPTNWQ